MLLRWGKRLTCYSDVSIRFSLLDDLEHILRTRHESLGSTFHIRNAILVLMDTQIDLRDVEQIPDLVHVDFIVRDFDVELEVHLHAVDVVEDVVDDARNDTLLRRITHDTLHRVSLTGGCLTISEDCSIVASQYVGHNGLRRLTVDFFLCCIWLEDLIEQINFSLREKTERRGNKLARA